MLSHDPSVQVKEQQKIADCLFSIDDLIYRERNCKNDQIDHNLKYNQDCLYNIVSSKFFYFHIFFTQSSINLSFTTISGIIPTLFILVFDV